MVLDFLSFFLILVIYLNVEELTHSSHVNSVRQTYQYESAGQIWAEPVYICSLRVFGDRCCVL